MSDQLSTAIFNATNCILVAVHNYIKSVLPEDTMDHDALDTHLEPYISEAVANAIVRSRGNG